MTSDWSLFDSPWNMGLLPCLCSLVETSLTQSANMVTSFLCVSSCVWWDLTSDWRLAHTPWKNGLLTCVCHLVCNDIWPWTEALPMIPANMGLLPFVCPLVFPEIGSIIEILPRPYILVWYNSGHSYFWNYSTWFLWMFFLASARFFEHCSLLFVRASQMTLK